MSQEYASGDGKRKILDASSSDEKIKPSKRAGSQPPTWLLSSQAFFAGWVSGAAGILVGHPFDTIKTLQQTQTRTATSIRASEIFKSVWKEYGVKGLFRGMAYPLVTYGAVNAAFFSGAEYARNFFFLQGHADDVKNLTYTQIFLAGCVGGVAQLFVVCPSELIKIKLQDQLNTGRHLYRGPMDCTVKLWQNHGIAGLYKGMTSCFVRDIYNWGIYLVTFELIRDKMMHHNFNYITSELCAGGLAGAISWISATPFDVVKSRIQASEKPLSIGSAVRELYQLGGELLGFCYTGLKPFTRGMLVSALRGFPSNAVVFFGFAEMMRGFERSNKVHYA